MRILHNRRAFCTAAVTAILATLGTVFIASGASASGSSASGSGQTLTVSDGDLDTLLPAASELSFNELDQLWAPIAAFNANGSLKYVQAKSIKQSGHDKVWTIKFRSGWTFHNGEPVTAASYADAWNFTADKANAMANASELAEIKGYSAVNPASGKAKATKMSGLKVLGHETLRVTLSHPDSQFPDELISGDLAFYPMPAAGLKDPASFKTDPIGDGPYEMASPANLDEQVPLKAYPGYKGTKPNISNLTFKLFSNADTAYTATQAGSVDIDAITPQDKYTSIKPDFGSRVLNVPGESIDFLGFPIFDKKFENPKLREAVSLAIDRPAIARALLGNQSSPATGVLGPGLLGGGAKQCNYCGFDPAKARTLLTQAGGWQGTMVIEYPGGAGYDQEFQAIANELSQNLHIKSVRAQPASGFGPYLAALEKRQYTDGPFRGHWGSLTPSSGQTLAALFEVGGGGNDATGFYSDPKVTRLITAGNGAASPGDAVKDYQAAAKIILDQRVVVPLFFPTYPFVYAANVHNLKATPHEIGIDLSAVTLG